MFSNPQSFLNVYEKENVLTARVLENLTDKSLSQEKAPGHNTVGDIAWLIAVAPVHWLRDCGFRFGGEYEKKPAILDVPMIEDTYRHICNQVKQQVAVKSKADLERAYPVMDMPDMPLGEILGQLIHMEIHHRGQLTVLMRQLNLPVPRLYGPNYEETQSQKRRMAAH